MTTSTMLPFAPPMGAALGLLYVHLRHNINPAELWRTSSTAYRVVTLGSVFLSAAMLTLIQPS